MKRAANELLASLGHRLAVSLGPEHLSAWTSLADAGGDGVPAEFAAALRRAVDEMPHGQRQQQTAQAAKKGEDEEQEMSVGEGGDVDPAMQAFAALHAYVRSHEEQLFPLAWRRCLEAVKQLQKHSASLVGQAAAASSAAAETPSLHLFSPEVMAELAEEADEGTRKAVLLCPEVTPAVVSALEVPLDQSLLVFRGAQCSSAQTVLAQMNQYALAADARDAGDIKATLAVFRLRWAGVMRDAPQSASESDADQFLALSSRLVFAHFRRLGAAALPPSYAGFVRLVTTPPIVSSGAQQSSTAVHLLDFLIQCLEHDEELSDAHASIAVALANYAMGSVVTPEERFRALSLREATRVLLLCHSGESERFGGLGKQLLQHVRKLPRALRRFIQDSNVASEPVKKTQQALALTTAELQALVRFADMDAFDDDEEDGDGDVAMSSAPASGLLGQQGLDFVIDTGKKEDEEAPQEEEEEDKEAVQVRGTIDGLIDNIVAASGDEEEQDDDGDQQMKDAEPEVTPTRRTRRSKRKAVEEQTDDAGDEDEDEAEPVATPTRRSKRRKQAATVSQSARPARRSRRRRSATKKYGTPS